MRDEAVAWAQGDFLDRPCDLRATLPWPETLVYQSIKPSPARNEVQARSRVALTSTDARTPK